MSTATGSETPGIEALQFEGSLYQIAVVVRNLEQGMAHYSTLLGLGPYARIDTDYNGRYRDWTGPDFQSQCVCSLGRPLSRDDRTWYRQQ